MLYAGIVTRAHGAALLSVVILLGACSRIADIQDEPIDYEALRAEACAANCEVMDTCEPDRFAGMVPDDCYVRCMTMLPLLLEENQCGSRQIIELNCTGSLTCEEFAASQEGNNLAEHPPDYSAPCVTEIHWSGLCDEDQPFDLNEPVPPVP